MNALQSSKQSWERHHIAVSMDKMAENISTQEKWISEQNNKIEQPYNSITPLTKLITQKQSPNNNAPDGAVALITQMGLGHLKATLMP